MPGNPASVCPRFTGLAALTTPGDRELMRAFARTALAFVRIPNATSPTPGCVSVLAVWHVPSVLR